MASWGLLDDKEENELHKSRLLNVEEKPFKRITKRLNTLHAATTARARQAPTPPPETNGSTPQPQQQLLPDGASPAAPPPNNHTTTPAATSDAPLSSPADLAQLREDVTLDFAAFDSSIARLQFLLTANDRERERYGAERERILAASQGVRDTTLSLRARLEAARATLAQRRAFDVLADAITAQPALRPRAEQGVALQKLREEIAELEAESEAYGVTWHERREQFARIMEESMRLRRLIRDEKEEVERREGMDDENEAGATPRPSGVASRGSTPRPEGGLVPKGGGVGGGENGEAVGTPRPVSTAGGRTPARDSPAPEQDGQSFIAKRVADLGASFSQVGSQVGSHAGSREGSVHGDAEVEVEEGEDVEMGETKDDGSEPDSPLTPPPADDTPQIVVDGEADSMDTT